MQAFIWAFKPTQVVDIRRFPPEEAKATEEEIARLRGKPSQPGQPTAVDEAGGKPPPPHPDK